MRQLSRAVALPPVISVDTASGVWQYVWFMTKELRTQSLLLT
jgi:hypothetical protein